MKSFLFKYKLYFFSFAFAVAYLISYAIISHHDYDAIVSRLNAKILEYEQKLDRVAQLKLKETLKSGTLSSWKKSENNDEFKIHIYKNDSLIYWNTNQVPINRFADIHFPNDGINHLQNGWYLTKVKSANGYVIAVSLLVKNEYPYQNEHLVNRFSPNLGIPISAQVLIDKDSPLQIFNSKNEYLFSIIPSNKQIPSNIQAYILLALSLIAIALLIIALYISFRRSSLRYAWIFPLITIVLRGISLNYSRSFFDNEIAIFSKQFFYINEYFPNFYEYLINVFILVFVINCFIRYLKVISFSNVWLKTILFIFLGSTFLLWNFILFLVSSIVSKSEIYLFTDKFFSLNLLSYLALFTIGFLFYTYYSLLKHIVDAFNRENYRHGNLARILFLFSITFLIYFIYDSSYHIVGIIIPLLIGMWIILPNRRNPTFISFEINGLVLLIIAAIFVAFNLTWTNESKMNIECQKIAEELVSEKQEETEIEYQKIIEKIKSDTYLNRISHSKDTVDLNDFEYSIERKIFNGYWERYEMNFNLFDSIGGPIVTKENLKFKEINSLIKEHCIPSTLDSNIYYVSDYTEQLSYVILQPFYNDENVKFYLFVTLKSKKIPEGIGFPRLLISSESNVLRSFEKYSIAKYHNKKLVAKFGEFGYPSSPLLLPENQKKGNVKYGGYNHFILKKTSKDTIIISSRVFSIFETLTSVSYIFTFFGIIILPFYFIRSGKIIFKNTFSLALKIQMLLVGIVFFSLFAFGWGSGLFVKNQYNTFTTKIISEKLGSLEMEMRNKIGEMKYLDVNENGNYINFILSKLSKVFVTDINLYDADGYLLATSRPKIFNIGLIGEQMNSLAFNQLKIQNKSEFSHQENIGELNYISAYLPFFNSDGKLLAFVNLQHFGQQQELESQIQQFLIAIINVFVLLLAVSIILAIIMANWVTKPLRFLQINLSLLQFGKKNEIIQYENNDEIGVLINEYNKKLLELEQTAEQLKKSERESAWRDMAKQVAHEIKNPLTPMKLSIQQMMRVFDKENPVAKEKVNRLANSLIEQIDGLSRIANEFSNFAKMPSPILKKVELISVLENVISIFQQEKVSINFEKPEKKIEIQCDKDQIIRAVNNLLQNSIHACDGKKNALIEIKIYIETDVLRLAITDNGKGISLENQNKVFVPYFTTKSGGTGIGLSITKQIIENHKGKIYFDSKENEHTTFCIELPLN
ncbi:MAG: GHKL domain-containing protein [Bacteroidetes bacterium]|nr:GHKL domain-containing protein [Bacteroidota bacterium]